MFVVRCSLFAVSRSLLVACCLLRVVSGLSVVGRCLFFVVCWSLRVVACGSLCIVVCCLKFIVGCLLLFVLFVCFCCTYAFAVVVCCLLIVGRCSLVVLCCSL